MLGSTSCAHPMMPPSSVYNWESPCDASAWHATAERMPVLQCTRISRPSAGSCSATLRTLRCGCCRSTNGRETICASARVRTSSTNGRQPSCSIRRRTSSTPTRVNGSAAAGAAGPHVAPPQEASRLVSRVMGSASARGLKLMLVKRIAIASYMSTRPEITSPPRSSSTFRASVACRQPMTPGSTPTTPASAHEGTEPAGGGSGKRSR
mmetsp:Transcript_7312/g.14623  ORF Transcript_7312/g.14623 Transcript_7312/m.14623 type:complete len:208 (+) Transcript_7312:86-709(+)